MLSLALMLLLGPLDAPAANRVGSSTPNWQTREPGEGRSAQVTVSADAQRMLSGRCEPILRHVSPPSSTGVVKPLSTFSATPPAGEPRVRMYHLLERTIDGCRVPVIAIDHLPEADRAVGRVFGGDERPR